MLPTRSRSNQQYFINRTCYAQSVSAMDINVESLVSLMGGYVTHPLNLFFKFIGNFKFIITNVNLFPFHNKLEIAH